MKKHYSLMIARLCCFVLLIFAVFAPLTIPYVAHAQKTQLKDVVAGQSYSLKELDFQSAQDAVDQLSDFVSKNPTNYNMLNLLGIAYIQNFELQKGERTFLQLTQKEPSWIAFYNLSYSQLLQSKINNALASLKQAEKYNPKIFVIDSLRAEINRVSDNPASAEVSYDLAIDKSPKAHSLYAQLANFYYQTDELDKAIKSIDTAIKIEDFAYYFYLRAMILAKQKKYAEAVNTISKPINKSPQNPQNALLYWGRGTIQELQGKYQNALADQSKAVNLGFGAQGYVSRGVVYYRLGEYGKAEEDLLKHVRESKQINPRAYLYLGKIAYLKNNKQLASARFQAAVNANQLDPQINFGIAQFYLWQNEFEQAFAQYSQAIAHDNETAAFYFGRSQAAFKQNNPAMKSELLELALTDINKAIDLENKEGKYYQTKADILTEIGDQEQEARQLYQKACSMGVKESCR